MFSRILIANRGEIALRVIRACRELGVQSVVVYSEVDRGAAYLRCADEAICIGAGPAADSYLNIPRIISAAEIANVDAIHPGYGFLAENPHFAEVCESCKIKFIGPSSKVMAKLGNKIEARAMAKASKVPLVVGSPGPVENESDALKVSHEIGFPVMIKAAGGGGGRGMRVAHNDWCASRSVVSVIRTGRIRPPCACGHRDTGARESRQEARRSGTCRTLSIYEALAVRQCERPAIAGETEPRRG